MAAQTSAAARIRQEIIYVEQFIEPFPCLHDDVGRVVDDFPVRWLALTLPIRLAALRSAPAIEMADADDAYIVIVEAAGVAVRDIDIEAEQGLLVIKGVRKEPDPTRFERGFGAFERRIHLPADAELSAFHAAISGRRLTITIPRTRRAANAWREN
jgi:HSP20 family molecular chaperone IbpA